MRFFGTWCVASFLIARAASIDDVESLVQQSPTQAPSEDAFAFLNRVEQMEYKVKTAWQEKREKDIDDFEHAARKRYRAEVAVHEQNQQKKAARRDERKRNKAAEAAKTEERKRRREEEMQRQEHQAQK
uniref:Clathrin light chain n=1 Tax=Alexandrium andersonii TaxID=327968 RepID=A0A7S2EZB0_9DINO|mmetsp:Transcript_101243/g.227109  ORF Transcript_101243/g.227109 Transcript_101243/m.227109 type:complete len:129 (+) Transcript_101243:101-487(+)